MDDVAIPLSESADVDGVDPVSAPAGSILKRSDTGLPVSGVINLRVRATKLAAWEEWLRAITSELRLFPGYRDTDTIQGVQEGSAGVPFSVVLIFDTEADLRRWETSDERSELLRRAHELDLFENAEVKIRVQGSDRSVEWERPDDDASPPPKPAPPPKWRLFLVLWICVATSNVFQTGAGLFPALRDAGIGYPEAVLVSITPVVVIVVYALSELLTDLPLGPLSVARWLRSPAPSVDTSGARGMASVPRVVAAMAIDFLNSGCGCFNPVPEGEATARLSRQLSKVERRLEALKRHQHELLRAR